MAGLPREIAAVAPAIVLNRAERRRRDALLADRPPVSVSDGLPFAYPWGVERGDRKVLFHLIGAAGPIDVVIAALGSLDDVTREDGAWRGLDATGAEVLAARIGDSDPRIAGLAVRALHAFTLDRVALDRLRPALRARCLDGHPIARLAACEELLDQDAEPARDVDAHRGLAGLLDSSNAYVVVHALRSWRAWPPGEPAAGMPDPIAHVEALAMDPEPAVRAAALDWLSGRTYERDIPKVAELGLAALRDPSAWVRVEALQIVGQGNDPGLLIPLLDDLAENRIDYHYVGLGLEGEVDQHEEHLRMIGAADRGRVADWAAAELRGWMNGDGVPDPGDAGADAVIDGVRAWWEARSR